MMKLLMKLFTSKDSMFDMMTYKVITSSKIEDIVANVEKSWGVFKILCQPDIIKI